jgi:Ca-activated chloride channel family protein
MMRAFDAPGMLLGAVLLAAVAWLLVRAGAARRQGRLARYGTAAALARLAPPSALAPARAHAWRISLATLGLGIAIAGPRWGQSEQTLQVEGVDVAIAMDLSLSMLATDERPTRLERMKQEVRRLRASAPGDRVALIGFAGRSYVFVPLTADDGAIDLFLENLGPSVVGQAGSAIALPIQQGIDLLLASRGDADRALVLMSDGEAFDDHAEALAMAVQARAAGIHVVTVGFGTATGSVIPIAGPNGPTTKRDENGEVVITRYDETLLAALAQAAGGEFVPASATDKGNRIRQVLAGLEASTREEALRLSRPLRYQWFAALAFVLLLLDAVAADGGRWPRWRQWVPRLRGRRAASTRVLVVALGVVASLRPIQLVAQVRVAQAPSARDAFAAQREGAAADAIRLYRAVIAAGDRRPLVLYNLGTALLAADSLDGAVDALERALLSRDAALRVRARYNLGLAYLRRGLRLDGDARSAALTNARRAFRTVLLETPGDPDAQWNYELALRAPTGGGGGASSPQPQGGASPPPHAAQGPMSKQQAEALLDAAAREERETQARRQRGNTPLRSAGQKDW